MADFARALSRPVDDGVHGGLAPTARRRRSSGVVRILKDLDRDIAGRHVLVVEDIVDSGLTLSWLLRNLQRPAAGLASRSWRCCASRTRSRSTCRCRYVGFDIPNEFVVGYGLDYAERYRDLPYIGPAHSREVYTGDGTPRASRLGAVPGDEASRPGCAVRLRSCPVYLVLAHGDRSPGDVARSRRPPAWSGRNGAAGHGVSAEIWIVVASSGRRGSGSSSACWSCSPCRPLFRRQRRLHEGHDLDRARPDRERQRTRRSGQRPRADASTST